MCCLLLCEANPYSNLLKYCVTKSDFSNNFFKTQVTLLSFHTIHNYKKIQLFHKFEDFLLKIEYFLNSSVNILVEVLLKLSTKYCLIKSKCSRYFCKTRITVLFFIPYIGIKHIYLFHKFRDFSLKIEHFLNLFS